MYIVAIGWIYVVLMMSITEESAVAGIMTFLFYGVLPVSIILYLSGSRRRKRNREAAAAGSGQSSDPSSDPTSNQTQPTVAAQAERE